MVAWTLPSAIYPPPRRRFVRRCVEAHRVGVDGRAGCAKLAQGAYDAWVPSDDPSNGADAAVARRPDVACVNGARGESSVVALSVVGSDMRVEWREQDEVRERAGKCDVWHAIADVSAV